MTRIGHTIVTPDTEKECDMTVLLEPTGNERFRGTVQHGFLQNSCNRQHHTLLKFLRGDRRVYYCDKKQLRGAWLCILKTAPSSAEEIGLWSWIECGKEPNMAIELSMRLYAEEGGKVEFEISREMLSRAYIFLGFSERVYDGGSRYTVDLPAYVKVL